MILTVQQFYNILCASVGQTDGLNTINMHRGNYPDNILNTISVWPSQHGLLWFEYGVSVLSVVKLKIHVSI